MFCTENLLHLFCRLFFDVIVPAKIVFLPYPSRLVSLYGHSTAESLSLFERKKVS